MHFGENGIITMTEVAQEESKKAQIQEEIQLKLTEIVADKLAQNIQITNNLIKEELESKLLGIEVTEELTGTYKGYEYWIDENNNVHIGEKANNPITVKVMLTYIGTSSCTVEVEASSKEGNIVGYIYKVGDIETEQLTSNTYTIDELEPNTQYIVSVIAIDEHGNRKSSIPIKIVTEARTYLYKEGNECIELTGGWKRGNYNIGSFTKKEDHLNLNVNISQNIQYWNSCQTTNSIDITEFKNIVYKFKIDNMTKINGKYTAWANLAIFNPQFVNYNSHKDNTCRARIFLNNMEKNIKNQITTYKINIANIKEKVYPTVYIARHSTGTFNFNIDIYEVWLEK